MAHDLDKFNRSLRKLESSAVEEGSVWWHKTGDFYIVVGDGLIEATLEPAVIYTAYRTTGIKWIRPLSEFLDGRFTPVEVDESGNPVIK